MNFHMIKKNTNSKISSILCLLLLFTILSGCTDNTEPEKQQIVQGNTEIIPQNVIQIGESYEYYPKLADGHLLCTVTKARIVTTQSECPSVEWFESGPEEVLLGDDGTAYRYDNWFSENGAFANNFRILLVDMSITNVNAVAWLCDGTPSLSSGWFADPYTFYVHETVGLIDLTVVSKEKDFQQYHEIGSFGYSRWGEIENDINTKGNEPWAIRVQPGETVTYALAYPIHPNKDGTARDFSTLMLCASSVADPENGIFVDMKLGED